jgi:hypothetical protein
MLTELLSGQNQTSVVIGALALVALSSLVRAYITYRKTLVEQESRTSRLAQALKGAKPDQRPEIIRAFGQLERAPSTDHVQERSITGSTAAHTDRNERDAKSPGG